MDNMAIICVPKVGILPDSFRVYVHSLRSVGRPRHPGEPNQPWSKLLFTGYVRPQYDRHTLTRSSCVLL
jgi:hypothetical protein